MRGRSGRQGVESEGGQSPAIPQPDAPTVSHLSTLHPKTPLASAGSLPQAAAAGRGRRRRGRSCQQRTGAKRTGLANSAGREGDGAKRRLRAPLAPPGGGRYPTGRASLGHHTHQRECTPASPTGTPRCQHPPATRRASQTVPPTGLGQSPTLLGVPRRAQGAGARSNQSAPPMNKQRRRRISNGSRGAAGLARAIRRTRAALALTAGSPAMAAHCLRPPPSHRARAHSGGGGGTHHPPPPQSPPDHCPSAELHCQAPPSPTLSPSPPPLHWVSHCRFITPVGSRLQGRRGAEGAPRRRAPAAPAPAVPPKPPLCLRHCRRGCPPPHPPGISPMCRCPPHTASLPAPLWPDSTAVIRHKRRRDRRPCLGGNGRVYLRIWAGVGRGGCAIEAPHTRGRGPTGSLDGRGMAVNQAGDARGGPHQRALPPLDAGVLTDSGPHWRPRQ